MNISRPVNILFLGGAKRVSMARHFKAAASSMGLRCNIFSYELSYREPIAEEATVIVGLKWSDPLVDDDLRRIIAERKVDIIVPFVDGAVAVASRLRDVTFVPVGDEAGVNAMFNKVQAATAFEFAGLPVPETWAEGSPIEYLIAKPAYGSASQGIIAIDDRTTLDRVLSAGKGAYLIQRRIDHRIEYTVDCYADTVTGDVLVAVPRRRLAVSGGEATRTVTVSEPRLEQLSRKAIKSLDLRGAVTVQFIHDLDTDRFLLMEINPRLGGGAVCSVAAGADLPSLIIRQAFRLPLTAPEWKAGVEIARYPAEVVFMP